MAFNLFYPLMLLLKQDPAVVTLAVRSVFRNFPVFEVTEIGLDVPVPADLARRLRKKGMAVSEKCMTDEELGEALCPFVSKM